MFVQRYYEKPYGLGSPDSFCSFLTLIIGRKYVIGNNYDEIPNFIEIIRFERVKKALTLLFYGITMVMSLNAQHLDFAYSDLAEAKSVAKESDKLIFVDIYADWCGPCKAMEQSIFTKAEVGDYFNEYFLNLKIDSETAKGRELVIEYAIKEYPTYLFLNKHGEIVYKIVGFHSVNNLLHEATKAEKSKKEFVSLRKLDLAYENGNQDSGFLYTYLKRKSFEQGTQPTILDRYLSVVPENEIKTEKVLSLISDNVNSVSSKGFAILSESLSRFMMMTESQQKAILRGIAHSKKMTFREAVTKKDDVLFEVLIDAVHNTSYSMEAAFAEERQFRYDYAKLTRNFKHFKIIAEEEANQILLNSPKDFEQQTALTIKEFERSAEEKGISSSSGQYKMMREGLEKGASKSASFQLNEFARVYYELAEEDIDIKNAIKWSAYSIKLAETPANWETYAFLLKKSGRKKDAKKAMKQAVKLAKQEGIETESFKKKYQKIK
jgi:thiol-disulfide isomerase/thioredoxin